jgi:hypothetical protein
MFFAEIFNQVNEFRVMIIAEDPAEGGDGGGDDVTFRRTQVGVEVAAHDGEEEIMGVFDFRVGFPEVVGGWSFRWW